MEESNQSCACCDLYRMLIGVISRRAIFTMTHELDGSPTRVLLCLCTLFGDIVYDRERPDQLLLLIHLPNRFTDKTKDRKEETIEY